MPMFSYNSRKRKASSALIKSTPKRTKFYARTQHTFPVYRTVQSYVPKRYSKELKYDSGTVSLANISTTGHITNLLSIANGTGPQDRIGQNINLHSFRAKFRFTTAANNSGNCITVSYVYDRQTNGALPNITDIFNSADPIAVPNQTNVARFTILWQKTIQTQQSNAGTVDNFFNGVAPCDVSFSLLGKKTQFLGTGATITGIDSGSLLQVVTCTNNNVNGMETSELIKFYE